MTVNFRHAGAVTPYHETGTLFIGLTTNAGSADSFAASHPSVFRINRDRWPKELNRVKKKVRYVFKEVGTRNFLVVMTEGSDL